MQAPNFNERVLTMSDHDERYQYEIDRSPLQGVKSSPDWKEDVALK